MTLAIRDLRGDDLFPLLAIVGKLDVVDKVTDLFAEQTGPLDEAAIRARGARAVAAIARAALANIGLVRGDLNKFLADVTGADLATIKELGLIEYVGLIKALFARPEFRQVFSLAVSQETAGLTD